MDRHDAEEPAEADPGSLIRRDAAALARALRAGAGDRERPASAPAAEAQAGNRMFPVLVRLSREDLEAVGLERLRRGYTAQAKIVTRDERMITLIGEYLLRRQEIRERTKRRVEKGAQLDRAPLTGLDWSGFPPVRPRPVSSAQG